MEIGYDIFQRINGNVLVWVGKVHELQQARNRILNLKSTSPGTYLIFDSRERTVLEVFGEHRLPPCAEPGEKELALKTGINHRGTLEPLVGFCKGRFAGISFRWGEFIRQMGLEETRIQCEDTLRRTRKSKRRLILAAAAGARQATSSDDEAPAERILFDIIGDWAAAAREKATTWLSAAMSHTSSRVRSACAGVSAFARRARTRHLQWQQIRRERGNNLEKLLANSSEPMVVTNSARRFVNANPAALALFGVSKANIGKFAIDAFLSTRQVHCFAGSGPPLVRGATRLGECEVRCLDGRVKTVGYIFQPNFIPGRNLANFRDLSPRKETSAVQQRESARVPEISVPYGARSFREVGSGGLTCIGAVKFRAATTREVDYTDSN